LDAIGLVPGDDEHRGTYGGCRARVEGDRAPGRGDATHLQRARDRVGLLVGGQLLERCAYRVRLDRVEIDRAFDAVSFPGRCPLDVARSLLPKSLHRDRLPQPAEVLL